MSWACFALITFLPLRDKWVTEGRNEVMVGVVAVVVIEAKTTTKMTMKNLEICSNRRTQIHGQTRSAHAAV